MKKIIVANWKMNPGTAKEARRIFERIRAFSKRMRGVKAVVAPPDIYLPLFNPTAKLKLGAQDVASSDPPAGGGAWTGEVSAKMLRNIGVSYAIVGHSERRELGESDAVVGEKLYQALLGGLRAILCVGE
ncbi:MAG: triose-phosphate isomerase family protein, partial [bacterium]|nr:triose-phosphate isomerase family protein [bacterium]